MRPILKGAEPEVFTQWKKGESPDWSPGWDDLDGTPTKSAVKEALLKEQGHVCCYCEQRIQKTDSHIEHLESRHDVPQRSLDYTNLLACCTREEPRIPKHCGSRKGDRALKVHPLLPDCREYFVFTGSGDVRPTDVPAHKEVAREAIAVLGLDVPKLAAMRKMAIDGVIQALAGVEQSQARAVIARIDARDGQGWNAPFTSAILSALQPRP
jgi:uncharacterized protein (TIGR02646 family)